MLPADRLAFRSALVPHWQLPQISKRCQTNQAIIDDTNDTVRTHRTGTCQRPSIEDRDSGEMDLVDPTFTEVVGESGSVSGVRGDRFLPESMVDST